MHRVVRYLGCRHQLYLTFALKFYHVFEVLYNVDESVFFTANFTAIDDVPGFLESCFLINTEHAISLPTI